MSSVEPIEENFEPGIGLTTPSTRATEKNRSLLLKALLFIAAGLVLTGCIGWLWHGNEVDRMQSFAIVFSPIMTLLGTAVGFYFSDRN